LIFNASFHLQSIPQYVCPQFLRLEYCTPTRLEPIESLPTNYHERFRKVSLSSPLPIRDPYSMPAVVLRSLVPVSPKSHYNNTFPHCSSKCSPSCSVSAFALCGTRVVHLLLSQFSNKLEMEAKVILTLSIKLIDDKTDAGEPWGGWGVLAMEIQVRLPSLPY
jgi:hypothetical protein